MQEGALGVWNEGVRDPEEWHETSVHANALVTWEHQPGVPPPLTEEDGGRVVLKSQWQEYLFIHCFPSLFFFVRCVPYWFRRWHQCWRYQDSFQSQQDPLSQVETTNKPFISLGNTQAFNQLQQSKLFWCNSYHWNLVWGSGCILSSAFGLLVAAGSHSSLPSGGSDTCSH